MKDGFVRIAAVSPQLRVVDCDFNSDNIIEKVKEADSKQVKLLVFPELSITSYTANDLFKQDVLLEASLDSLARIAEETRECDVLFYVGLPIRVEGKLYNTAAALFHGEVLCFIPKTNLPNYDEFYEKRWFTPAFSGIRSINFRGKSVPFGTDIIIRDPSIDGFSVACEICEDLWVPQPPSTRHALAGANIIVNLSASDELIGKEEYRRDMIKVMSGRLISTYIYASAGEGESTTDMVFTAHNMIVENGSILNEENFAGDDLLVAETDVFKLLHERMNTSTYPDVKDEGYLKIDIKLERVDYKLTRHFSRYPFVPSGEKERVERCEKIITLQSLGLKKRIKHTNAKSAVVGLSGGLDSTLALLVTVKAFDMLGRDRKDIIAVTMPCFGTTKRTRSNAELLATALKVSFKEVNITKSVRQHFEDIGHDESVTDVTYENSQARERTQVLMDIANQCGGLVIGTGDLSELALGWATYNGDHMSMYGVNASIPKTLVRYLVKYFADNNYSGASESLYDILATPVSPELLPAKGDGTISQVTEDLVGPYELHDFFLFYIVRLGFAPKKVLRLAVHSFEGVYEEEFIKKWLSVFTRRFFAMQFKRSCLPDGPKVGSVTFSPRSDWRMPSDAVRTLWEI
ncbi:MAG: NAD(+) synthase [Sphaerochaetaceae bacterium]|nr:NAD(+) synthase [Sphaerochaetaceae bacterium]